MSGRYAAIVGALACEADQAARAKAEQNAAKAKQKAAAVEQEMHDLKKKKGLGLEYILKSSSATQTRLESVRGSEAYLNKRLNVLESILSAPINKSPISLELLKKPEPTAAIYEDMPKLTLLAALDEVIEHNRQVDEFATALRSRDVDAICGYFELILQCSIYPDGFHKNSRIAYEDGSRHLVVDYQLPTVDEIVPTAEGPKRLRWSQDTIELKKSGRGRKQVYGNVIPSTVLRLIDEILKSDQYDYVEVATINAFVETIDRGTGHQIRPYILSVRATRDEFESLNLQQVDASVCLKRLTATVSRSAAELVPIKPIVDINMFDPRFVKEQNIIAELDNRNKFNDSLTW
ncbi:MAG TPA: hypothetical protein VNY10_16980 [Roseiarcus sp.]|nr:hypothetical protein [Roseiarcus sp.]